MRRLVTVFFLLGLLQDQLAREGQGIQQDCFGPVSVEESDAGIQVPLTAEIHNALTEYEVSGAQHGTSGNNSDRLRSICQETRTTKANVATALQMITWGVKVNDYGNAQLDENGEFIKVPGKGVTEALWADMVAYAQDKGLKGGNYNVVLW